MVRNCELCGIEFKSNIKNKKYCTNKCKRQVVASCFYCDKEVTRYKRKDGIYFCDSKCSNLESGRSVNLDCEQCGLSFVSKKSAVEKSNRKYCSKECQNESQKRSITLICKNCSKDFSVLPCLFNQSYCSKKCSDESCRIPIDKDLLVELYSEQELTSRDIAYLVGRNKKIVIDYLRYHDIPVRPDGFKNTARIKCKDGHEVRSYYERTFDNYLFKEGIQHEYDPRLPFSKRHMADFKINDVYVEIWGMMDIKRYREGREKKLNLYKENGCTLLEIYPSDFKDLGIKMKELKRLIK